jgi:hypothetical protein
VKEIAKKVNLLKPVNVGKIAIKRDHYFSGAYIIDLPLDSTPDHVWQDIFEYEWKSSRHLWDRKLFVMGDKLRLVTAPNEIGSKLDWVKQILDQTNKGIDDYNREAEARMAQMEEQAEKQRLEDEARIEKLRDMIRSSFGAF